MRQLHQQQNLSYRDVARNSGDELGKSGVGRIVTGNRLPAKKSTLTAYLNGCGVTNPIERQLWINKWTQLRNTAPRSPALLL
ncbi:helix-turn-helix domain-containing protein [Saccharothrix obliqua]|uniref:helix-turn-helix domain-containing protein n=1 Tax=Saccharothrix obliqua TaxID=2861747 RepID=UPI001C5D95F8|nr:helix-turn-helix domain-containing protein [Saccharothrix obliqua]MBW4722308.1 helix-turn-helix domain-containing protein [Saccharothrix obliqua]